MDVATFRWVLIIVGLLIVAGILLFGNPNRQKKPRASRKRKRSRASRLVPTLGASDSGAEAAAAPEGEAQQAEFDIGEEGATQDGAPDGAPATPSKPAGPPPDHIVTLYLLARDNHRITGVDLLDAAIKSGLVFGEHDIFHRGHDGDDEPVLSMANLTNPGFFDKEAWNTLETIGVTLFMTLPGPAKGLDAWDATRLAVFLHGDAGDRAAAARGQEGMIASDLLEALPDALRALGPGGRAR